MKVFLLNPNWTLHDNIYTATITQPVFPLELLYTATLLSKKNDIQIFDAYQKNATSNDLLLALRNFNPDVVIIETAPTYLFWRCCPLDIELPVTLSKLVKTHTNAKVAVIGPHSSSSPKWTLKKTRADFLFRGEPELSVTAFINSDCTDHQIPGLYTDVVDNDIAAVDELSALPEIDFRYIDIQQYPVYLYESKGYHIVPVRPENDLIGATIESSRGCPFNCPYCFKQLFRDTFRYRPIDKVIAEINQLKKRGVTFFNFMDEIFNLPNNHTRELLAELKKCNIQFGCQCRPDIMTEEILNLMVEAGNIHIEYGLENLDQNALKAIGKNTSLEKALTIIEKTKSLIPYTATFMLEFDPLTFDQDLQNTKRNVLERCEISPARPYPTTQLFHNLQKNLDITIPEDKEWELIQKYVWHLGRIYKWIPLKMFLKIPFCVILITTTILRKCLYIFSRKS